MLEGGFTRSANTWGTAEQKVLAAVVTSGTKTRALRSTERRGSCGTRSVVHQRKFNSLVSQRFINKPVGIEPPMRRMVAAPSGGLAHVVTRQRMLLLGIGFAFVFGLSLLFHGTASAATSGSSSPAPVSTDLLQPITSVTSEGVSNIGSAATGISGALTTVVNTATQTTTRRVSPTSTVPTTIANIRRLRPRRTVPRHDEATRSP